MDELWRVRWEFRDRSGYGAAMSREQATAAAARSNVIDPAIRHWAEPIPERERAAIKRRGTAPAVPHPG